MISKGTTMSFNIFDPKVREKLLPQYFYKKKMLICSNKLNKLIASLCLTLVTTSCAVTTGVFETSSKRASSFNLHVNHGQPLDIYVQQFSRLSRMDAELEAWRSTKLFTEVRRTNVDLPTEQGYFLRINCEADSWENTSGFAHVVLWVFTAFTFPALAEEEQQSCKSTLYENGIQIASTETIFEYLLVGNGWGVIPLVLKTEKINAEHAQTLANHRVRKTLDAWSRRTIQ